MNEYSLTFSRKHIKRHSQFILLRDLARTRILMRAKLKVKQKAKTRAKTKVPANTKKCARVSFSERTVVTGMPAKTKTSNPKFQRARYELL